MKRNLTEMTAKLSLPSPWWYLHQTIAWRLTLLQLWYVLCWICCFVQLAARLTRDSMPTAVQHKLNAEGRRSNLHGIPAACAYCPSAGHYGYRDICRPREELTKLLNQVATDIFTLLSCEKTLKLYIKLVLWGQSPQIRAILETARVALYGWPLLTKWHLV